MDSKNICRRLVEVTKTLTPSSVELTSIEDDVLTVRIVADSFQGIPLVRRFKQLAELCAEQAPEISQNYSLIFEALTSAEQKSLQPDANDDDSSDSDEFHKAAKPHDDARG